MHKSPPLDMADVCREIFCRSAYVDKLRERISESTHA
ncbi:MAG: hypothetical protein JWR15_1305 [Prosthecobacter sp.]|nr:hypothetical protein [Prosthecobacter sp.]